MTQCVVVLGLLCVEMCLLWSWFGLFFNFLFELARRCYCCLFRWSACLLISSFFLRLFFCNVEFLHKYCKCSNTNPHLSPPHLWPPVSFSLSLSHAQKPTYTHPASPPTPRLPLCSFISVSLQLLTDFLVFLQSRKASEQAKSVDSKTDSIGSGRAIPIKQVSSFPNIFPTLPIVHWVSMNLFFWPFLLDVDILSVTGLITVLNT